MTAGYSSTPLIQKLGIKPGMKIFVVDPPEDYNKMLDFNIRPQLCSLADKPDLVHIFSRNFSSFEKQMKTLKPVIKKNTSLIIWVSWLKKSSGIITDITEDIIRNYALQNELVDVKVCAINNAWSGLKLVVPLVKRS